MTADIGPLAEVCNRTVRADYADFLTAESVEQYIASDAVVHYLQQNIEQCAVILADDRLVGCSIVIENRVDLLIIDHDLHRRGLGTQLLLHSEELLFDRYERLTLESFAPNEKANKFYRKHGWVETDRYFDKTAGVDKIVFCKPA